MASVTSPLNSAGESVDALVTTSGVTGIMKGAVGAASVSGGDSQVAAQEVATMVDDAAFTPASGKIVVIGGFADETSPDSVNEGDGGALRMTLARNLHTVEVCDTAAVTTVNSTNSSTTLLAANANRIGATIHNTDANALYVKFGATASTSSFTVKIASDGYYEFARPVYRGIVDGIWSADGAGLAAITELT